MQYLIIEESAAWTSQEQDRGSHIRIFSGTTYRGLAPIPDTLNEKLHD